MTASIAVLPFLNMSSDPENEYFSDGITEEIINALTHIRGLKVTARTSSFSFKNKNEDIRVIGQKLGVQALIEGSVRKFRNDVRINTQLIRVADGFHLWSGKFDRELKDIFMVQDEISLLIADRVREGFGHFDIADRLVNDPQVDPHTYQKYLKARFLLNKFNPNDIEKGIQILKDVQKCQPQFALAHLYIQYGFNMLAASGLMPAKKALSKGKVYLDKAIQINPDLPEAHHSFGWHHLNWNWDFKKAEKHLVRAIELRPGYAGAHQKLFITYALEGKLELAYQHIQEAYQLDPLSPLSNYFMGYYFYIAERYFESNRYFQNMLELEPSFLVGYSIFALSLFQQNRPDLILKMVAEIPSVTGAKQEKLIMLTLASILKKQNSDFEHYLSRLFEEMDGAFAERIRFFSIFIHVFQGQLEKAFLLIERGVKYREPLMTLLKVDPLLKPLHFSPHWNNLIEQIYALSSSPIARKERLSPVMSPKDSKVQLERLETLMRTEKPYLNPSLSIRDLAAQLGLNPNKLSWLVNDGVGQNFNEFVNGYRLETFKKKALDPNNQHLTLLGLAFESGFNSKTAFNNVFKKTMGKTPRAWLKGN